MRIVGFVLMVLMGGLGAVGQSVAPEKLPKFDVISVKPNHSGEQRGQLQFLPDGDRIVVINVPMFRILAFAFNFQRDQLILGLPEWTKTERWDMEAKVAQEDLAAFHALDDQQRKTMLQLILMERCKMQAKVVKKEVPIYALVVAKTGLKMHSAPAERDKDGRLVKDWDIRQKAGEIRGRAVPMEALMYVLTNVSVGRQIVDRTGLKGEYDFDLVWTPEEDGGSDAGVGDAARVSIFTAVQEQLGLKLEATKGMVDALDVERIEKPTEN